MGVEGEDFRTELGLMRGSFDQNLISQTSIMWTFFNLIQSWKNIESYLSSYL